MEILVAVTRGREPDLIYRSCHSLNWGPHPMLLLAEEPVKSSLSGGRTDGMNRLSRAILCRYQTGAFRNHKHHVIL